MGSMLQDDRDHITLRVRAAALAVSHRLHRRYRQREGLH